MVILFIGLASHYTDGMTYQDQMLASQCVKMGHEVYFVSDAYEYVEGKLLEVPEQERILTNGVTLIQVKYDFVLCKMLTEKLRKCGKIKDIIERIAPHIIYLHGPSTVAVYDVLKYKESHPGVKLMVDSHTDYYTSATNFISRKVLHGVVYKKLYRDCLKYVDKLLCISVNCMRFAAEVYKIPKERLELYSLGGVCVDEQTRRSMRREKREELGFTDEIVLFAQIGKLDKQKALLEALEIFMSFDVPHWRYLVIGSIDDAIQEKFVEYQKKDGRIIYLGWKNGEEIMACLAACDLYIQPGKVTAMAQNAMCMGKAVCLKWFEDYEVYMNGNGWLVESVEELKSVFSQIQDGNIDLQLYGEQSWKMAKELLDYEKLAEKICECV